MAVSAQPQLYVGGVNLNNRFSLEVLWKQTEGLFDGSALEPGATIQTFDGPAKVRAQDMAYQARRIVITGRIINRSGWLDKQKAIADLAQTFAGKPAIVRLGTLYLEVEFGSVKPVDDAYSHLPGYQTYRVEGEAIPGTLVSQYHTALGADQGLAVQDDRPDSAAVKFASNSFTYTNPGTAPAEACVALTGTAGTTYYLKGRGLRRVPMTTDAAGNAYIDEASGFLVYPGSNAIRVEDSAGALASGVTAVNLYGTRPRFLGNAPTAATVQSATTNRMSEGPMLTVARTGPATYINTAGTLSTATDGQAAITSNGLSLEGAATNLCKYSQDFDNALWVKNAATVSPNATTAPDGTSTADKVVESTANSSHSVEQVVAFTGATLANSIYLKAAGRMWAVVQYTASADTFAWINLSTGAVGNTSGSPQVTVESVGNGWYRVTVGGSSYSGASGTLRIYPTTGNGVVSYAGDGSSGIYVWGAQVETNPWATSYIPTTSATATRSADLCGIVYPQQELLHSHDLTQAGTWIVSGMTQPTKSGGDNTLTLAATTDHLYQAVTPSTVPSTTRTGVARLKLGTLSGSVLLRLLDQSGNVIASSTINTSSLSASEARTFYVTGTAASDDTGLRVQIIGNVGTGTILVRSLVLVQGSHPGVEVTTGDTAIPAPTSPALDPAWQQNGSIKWRGVSPINPTGPGANLYLLGTDGGSSPLLRLAQYNGQQFHFDRRHNGTTGYGGTAGRGAIITPNGVSSANDGAQHAYELVWRNYTLNGTRYMPLELWVDDSMQSSIDVASLYGADEWESIDPTALVSGGSVNATISAPSNGQMLSFPTLPAGAIPA